MKFEEMCSARRALETAEKVIVCFQLDDIGYAVITELRDSWVKRDRESSSRGGKLKARIRLSQLDRAALHNRTTCRRLGTMKELTAAYAEAYTQVKGKKAPHNKGYVFECAVIQRLGKQEWKPDRTPFWKAPDVVINGIGYQIKAEGAEWFTEKSIQTAIEETGY